LSATIVLVFHVRISKNAEIVQLLLERLPISSSEPAKCKLDLADT